MPPMSLDLHAQLPLTPSSVPGPYRVADYFGYEGAERLELLHGHLYVVPSPTLIHQIVVARVHDLLDRIALRCGGHAFLAPLDVVLSDHSVVQPDLIYLGPERRALAQDRIRGIPDLLVEVLSPSTVRRDRGTKRALYARCGVPEYWIVEISERQFDAYVLADGRYEVVEAIDGIYRSPLRPEVEFDLAHLWNEVDRRLPQAP